MYYLIAIAVLSAPPPAEVHLCDNFQTVIIQPEKVVEGTTYRSESTTEYVSSCGMGCCLVPVKRNRRVPVKSTVNHPTPLAEIEQALAQINLTQGDVLYDLGCGDGRVCVMAVKAFGAKAVGIDRRQKAIDLAQQNVDLNRCSESIKLFPYNLFDCEWTRPTVVYCYLDASLMQRVQRLIEQHPGIRAAVSYKHPWPSGGQQVGDFYVWERQERRRTAKASDEYKAPIPDNYSARVTHHRGGG
jgi:SAM-dependent methyltransferase